MNFAFITLVSDLFQCSNTLQYYGHREKLRLIGREDDLEKLNKGALEIAKKIATEHNKLFAGGICNTGVYNPEDESTFDTVNAMFKVSPCTTSSDFTIE